MSQAQTVQRIDIIDFGVYTVETERLIPVPDTVRGTVQPGVNAKFVQHTTNIIGRIGTHFGFKCHIVGTPNTTVELTLIMRIPAPGIYNPKTGKTTLITKLPYTNTIGDECFVGYKFDEAFEIVLGTWTIELWDGDRKLASQSFNVVKE